MAHEEEVVSSLKGIEESSKSIPTV